MSLINDALKRAAQKPAPPPSAAGFKPAEDRPHHFAIVLWLIIVIPIIALGVWFLAKGLRMHDRPQPVPVAARAPEPVAPPPIAVVQVTNPSATMPEPVYKLQGIFWRPTKPSAVVNGKTLFIGDRLQNARVAAIDQNSVTLKVDGQSAPLVLP